MPQESTGGLDTAKNPHTQRAQWGDPARKDHPILTVCRRKQLVLLSPSTNPAQEMLAGTPREALTLGQRAAGAARGRQS